MITTVSLAIMCHLSYYSIIDYIPDAIYYFT